MSGRHRRESARLLSQARPRHPGTTHVAVLAMVCVAAFWGGTYVMVKDAVAHLDVADFLAVRFAIATCCIAAVRPRALTGLGGAGWGRGVVLGLVLAAAYGSQTVGLRTVPASVSGFITGLMVVLTPLVAAAWTRERLPRSCWTAVAAATLGLSLLSLQRLSMSSGEALTLLCALAFAVHIVGTGAWASRHDAQGLVVAQLATVTAACMVVAAPGGLQLPGRPSVWGAVVFTALFATALSYFLQTWAQRHVSAPSAAVILTLEPVFALLAASGWVGERLGPRGALGAVVVLAAMVLAARVTASPSAQSLPAAEPRHASGRAPGPRPVSRAATA